VTEDTTEIVREDLLERIVDRLMQLGTGEKEATRTLDQILDAVDSDLTWEEIQSCLDAEDPADFDDQVIAFFGLIHDDRNTVDKLMTRFTAWEKEVGLR
jgi:hypothetical protein